MQSKQKFWAGSSALAGAGLVACGACCIPFASIAVATLGVGAIGSGVDEFVSLGVGAALLLLAAVLWHRNRQRPQACAASGSPCGCETKAPIACTLTPGEFKERAAWLQDLTDRALLSHSIFAAHALLRYRPDAKADVEVMVQQEQACCAFLQFELEEMEDHLLLTIKARNQDIGDLTLLLAHLTSAHRSQAQ
ncbi:hypothetical protein GTP81_06435 [Rugamonas sp. FT107W]|uniref:Mercuric transport protein MerT n=1 Tax=Duganella vulcania TaxID=2692166 RepID=A0A845HIB9_9BURK|nr:hypothetical protein [Duganella vulcania]MYN16386.1 hypothetical protein [Duganella vulcania]